MFIQFWEKVLLLWLAAGWLMSAEGTCPGATFPLVLCNSDINFYPPTFMPYVMTTHEQITFAADAIDFVAFVQAADITFTLNTKTIVRIWDSFVCRDEFQVTLNSQVLPVASASIIPNQPAGVSTCPKIVRAPNSASTFRSIYYAWTEFILDDPSQWNLNIKVRLQAGDIDRVGYIVHMFLETLPYNPPEACPFS